MESRYRKEPVPIIMRYYPGPPFLFPEYLYIYLVTCETV